MAEDFRGDGMTEKGVGIVQRERSGDGYGQWGSFLFFSQDPPQ